MRKITGGECRHLPDGCSWFKNISVKVGTKTAIFKDGVCSLLCTNIQTDRDAASGPDEPVNFTSGPYIEETTLERLVSFLEYSTSLIPTLGTRKASAVLTQLESTRATWSQRLLQKLQSSDSGLAPFEKALALLSPLSDDDGRDEGDVGSEAGRYREQDRIVPLNTENVAVLKVTLPLFGEIPSWLDHFGQFGEKPEMANDHLDFGEWRIDRLEKIGAQSNRKQPIHPSTPAPAITQASTNVPVHRGTRLVLDLPPLASWAALEEDCNHERCRHSDAHPSRVHRFRRSLLGSLMRNHPHFVVHLAIKAILANGTVFVQAAAVSASPSSDTT
ncbi:hypothetical protein B0H13DRAFT_1896141 [Mycena leptocephala]|nr:hypothetical protein B0H13DRAFT_1896141 [Mycena leptocephala]